MKISILTATFNRAHTLSAALDSLYAQRYRDFEHVIQDGGSTDGTLDLLRRRRDDRMRLVSEPDHGIYDALNRAIARCRGELVGVLHSDDAFASAEVLENVARIFAATNADAVYGDLQYVSRSQPQRVVRHWRAGAFRPGRLARGWMPPHPALFLRREIIETLGPFDATMRIAADYDAILRYFSRPGFNAVYLPQVLVRMRMGGESNRSIGRILCKSREDYQALRRNRVGGFRALALKNLSKLPQFL